MFQAYSKPGSTLSNTPKTSPAGLVDEAMIPSACLISEAEGLSGGSSCRCLITWHEEALTNPEATEWINRSASSRARSWRYRMTVFNQKHGGTLWVVGAALSLHGTCGTNGTRSKDGASQMTFSGRLHRVPKVRGIRSYFAYSRVFQKLWNTPVLNIFNDFWCSIHVVCSRKMEHQKPLISLGKKCSRNAPPKGGDYAPARWGGGVGHPKTLGASFVGAQT